MTEMETLVQKGLDLDAAGKKEDALMAYNDAFNILIDAAGAYAKEQMVGVTDIEELRLHTEEVFSHSKNYLKRDMHAASVLNAMGILFAEVGEYDNAAHKFEEAIEYIPDGVTYNDPSENLQGVIAKMTIAAETASEEEQS